MPILCSVTEETSSMVVERATCLLVRVTPTFTTRPGTARLTPHTTSSGPTGMTRSTSGYRQHWMF